MNILEALILGIVQGLTEFLPVSSSGHLSLLSRLTGVTPSVSYDLILHLATLIAVCVYERKRLWELIKKPFSKTAVCLYLSTALTLVVVVIIGDKADALFNGSGLGLSFLLTAIILFIGTLFPSGDKPITLPRAAIYGVVQGLCVFPGISRSGTTFTAGKVMGVSDEENIHYCFILSIPIIIGGAISSVIGGGLAAIAPVNIAVGFVSALVCATLSLRFISFAFGKKAIGAFIIYLVAASVLITVLGDILLLF